MVPKCSIKHWSEFCWEGISQTWVISVLWVLVKQTTLRNWISGRFKEQGWALLKKEHFAVSSLALQNPDWCISWLQAACVQSGFWHRIQFSCSLCVYVVYLETPPAIANSPCQDLKSSACQVVLGMTRTQRLTDRFMIKLKWRVITGIFNINKWTLLPKSRLTLGMVRHADSLSTQQQKHEGCCKLEARLAYRAVPG